MNVLRLIILTSLVALAGCSTTLSDKFRVDPLSHRTKDSAQRSGGIVLPPSKDGTGTERGAQGDAHPFDLDNGKLAGSEKTALVDAVGSKVARNRLQDYLIGLSDAICGQHKASILAKAASLNLTFSGITTILGGLGAVVTGVDATRILSGGAAMSNALRSGVNEHIYSNLFGTAIVRQIDSSRDKKRMEMTSRRADELETYTAEGMVRHVQDYHEACSFYAGLSGLADDKKRAPTSDEISGRIETLRNQYRTNNEMIAKLPAGDKDIDNLERANNQLTASISALQTQLTLLSGAPPPTTK